MKNFWSSFAKASEDKVKYKKLFRHGSSRAIYALAPMAGIADSAFRQMCKKFGADIVYSEMASTDALVYSPEKTLDMLRFEAKERPYVVQIFGSKPAHFSRAAKVVAEHIKPDGIDINFGCPVKKVAKQGAGAVLMNDLKLAREIIEATIAATCLPVSIKVRAKVGNVDVLKFLDNINDLGVKAVMIHGRTLSQGHSGEVDHNIIKKARSYFGGIILANGGVKDYDSAQELLIRTGADGIGIAQGALGRPWIFKAARTGQSAIRSARAVLKIAIKHAELAEMLKGQAGIIEMRKHLCWYVQGLPGARALRAELVKAESLKDIRKILT